MVDIKVKLIASTALHWDPWVYSVDPEDKPYTVGDYTARGERTGDHFIHDGTRDADELAEIAGRLCYKSWSRPNPVTSSNSGYLANIINQAHFSVLEHASATFWISGVSRSLTHELVRHRHLSFSQVSQRYVDESEGEFVYHPAIKPGSPEGDTLGRAATEARDDYMDIVRLLENAGIDRKTARGAARSVLPNATATELIVTGNHRTWRELLAKRLSPAADAEIRALAQALLVELKKIAPNTYQDMEHDETQG